MGGGSLSSPPASEPAWWLALLYAPGIGPGRYARLLNHFGSPQAVFEAGRSEWSALSLPTQISDYLAAPDWSRVESDLLWSERPGNHILCCNHPAYPGLLTRTERPPPVLFVCGDIHLLSRHQLAVVGTRNPSAAGRRTAHDFASHLAECGLVITSGLALGVDAAAHQGALAVGGATIAVMGTGLKRVYPGKHRELAHRIAEQGVLVSELALDTPPNAENFPRRNRIISGLSLGVLVVEAALRSGSLITARLATEQGREVFAIPGSIHNPLARGCHSLIRQGAKLVETGNDIIEELGPLAIAATTPSNPVPTAPIDDGEPVLDQEYRQLLEQMGAEALSIDTLVERSGLTAAAVSSMLLILELQGCVIAAPGGLYSRADTRGR